MSGKPPWPTNRPVAHAEIRKRHADCYAVTLNMFGEEMTKEDLLIIEFIQIDEKSKSNLSWIKHKKATTTHSGDPAFNTISGDGYLGGFLGGKRYYAHRVVFFLANGYWPDQIDHLDGDITNNAVSNLADKTKQQNMHNRIEKGYSKTPNGKFRTKITLNGKGICLGTFNSELEARVAYLNAKKKFHPSAPSRCFTA